MQTVMLLMLLLVPACLEAQTTRQRAWAALSAGVTHHGDLLRQGSVWYSPNVLTFGVRRSVAEYPVFTKRSDQETSALAGIRLQPDGAPHATMILAAGIARSGGWREPATGCSLGCQPGNRDLLTAAYAPAFALDVTATFRWVGFGLSFAGVGGDAGYLGLGLSLQLGVLR